MVIIVVIIKIEEEIMIIFSCSIVYRIGLGKRFYRFIFYVCVIFFFFGIIMEKLK